MTQERKHSPLPWVKDKGADYDGGDEHLHIRDADGESITSDTTYYPWAPEEEDMDFIVHACNNHYKLVEALRMIQADACDAGKKQGKTGAAWIAASCLETATNVLSAAEPAKQEG